MAATARTIGELLARHAGMAPDRPAIGAPGRAALRYGELHTASLRIAGALRARGIARGDRVALALPNGPEAAVAFLAVAAATTCAPLNPSCTEGELSFALGDLRVKALLVAQDRLPAAAAAARARALPVLDVQVSPSDPAGLFTVEGAGVARATPAETANAGDVALVLHTSGTTARPKIVPLTQHNLCASAGNIQRTLALGPDDVCLNVMPLFHIHGLMAALLASLAAGASVLCTSGFQAAAFPGWLAEDPAPTWYTAVPTIHQAVLDACAGRDVRAGSRLRFVRSSSASLPPRVLGELETCFGVPVIEAYGMTEAAHQMASNPLGAGARKVGSVGPAAGPEIAVLSESGRLLGRGAVGELVIRGETVTAGYEANPDANASAFVDGWFRTGDQGYVDDDGYVFLTGRLKELINRGGEKIAPREVEDALLRHPAVAQAAAFAVPHARLGEEVGAAVVLRAGVRATRDELRRAAADQLAYFKVPRRLEIVAAIPKGATGKVQRSALARQLGMDQPLRDGSAPPRSALERDLARAWSRLLACAEVGVEDDFFALGGDSLAAAEMIELVAELLGCDVPIADFLARPTIAGLVELREHALAGGASDADLVPLRRAGSEPPIFCTAAHDGGLWSVSKLVRHVPLDAPIHGLPAPPVGARGALPTIEDLAARNLAVVARVQPEGPVRLVGPCFGGTVALEMAIQLERSGRPVELLVMVNSFNRAWRRTTTEAAPVKLRTRHLLDRLRLHRERLLARDRGARLPYLHRRAALVRRHWSDEVRRALFEVITASGLPRPRALRRVGYASRHAQRAYRPRTYAGRVLMVRALAPIAGVYPLPYMGWGDALVGDVELLDVPGEQLEFWADDDQLRAAALRIATVLAGARRSAA